MFGGHLHQLSPVADYRPQGAHLRLRSKGRSQQTHRVQKLDPLTFMPVGASARYVLHMSCIHHTSSDSMGLQDLVNRNPVDAGTLHSHRGDATSCQPVGQCVQIGSKGLEDSYRLLVSVRWHSYVHLTGSNIN